jgi:YHS domain-containing protein
MDMNESKSATKDPICGMAVDETTALRAERDGQTFYFCSDLCRKKFLSTPAAVKPEDKPHGKAIYTCPMHPEVQQDHPGYCPKCGMALELKNRFGSRGRKLRTHGHDAPVLDWWGTRATSFSIGDGASDTIAGT